MVRGGSVSDSGKRSHCQTMPTSLTPMLEKQEAVSRDEQVKNENSNDSSIVGTLGAISEHQKPGGQGSSTNHLTTNENLIDEVPKPEVKPSPSTIKDDSFIELQGSEHEVVKVQQLRSAFQYNMAIQVEDKPIKAVVDSAAEVTIISDRVYKALKSPPNKLKDVKLLTAGRQMEMQGFVAGPVNLKIGDKWYQENVYIAPIEQDMLIGFDILVHRGKSIFDMAKGTLIFDNQLINLDMGSQGNTPLVARVTVAKRQVIPPNSVMRVKCAVDHELPVYANQWKVLKLLHLE